MIQPHLRYAHYCEDGHLFCCNERKLEKCPVELNKDESCNSDNYVSCGKLIDRTYELPYALEFKQVYNKDVFDGIMYNHEMSQFVYEVHKNLAILNETVEIICKKLNINSKLRDIR